MGLLDELRKKIFDKFDIKTAEEIDEKEKQSMPQLAMEELKTAKYVLGEIYIAGLAKNVGKKPINNLWDVVDSVEKYVLLRRVPNSDWFMDIETGEYYKQANTLIDNNVFCKIKYFKNDFKHKSYYVTEIMDLISVIDQEELTRSSLLSFDEIKSLYKKGWKYNFLKNDQKVNQIFQ